MKLKEIQLRQFRSHRDVTFEFGENLTMIIGPNGSGKTNILEAIATLCRGKSFRDGDEALISHGQDWWQIKAMWEGGLERELRYQPIQSRSKQLLVDGDSKGRFTYRHQLPIVLFEPDDLLMVHGSPSRRRAYLDTLIQSINPAYKQTLSAYERALVQRNNLLKKRQPQAQLKDAVFAWDLLLAEHGATIIAQRQQATTELNKLIGKEYSRLAGSTQSLRLDYQPTGPATTSTQLATQLARSLASDQQRGFTSHGPHRDDLDISLNAQPAKHSASRGEVRSLLLALKLAEASRLKAEQNVPPLLLLDDVFSELDHHRQAHLIETTKTLQTIITTTETHHLENKSRDVIIEL